LDELAAVVGQFNSRRSVGWRRVLRSVLWPTMGYRGAIRTVARSGMMVSLMLCLLALSAPQHSRFSYCSHMATAVLLSIYLFFSSRQELQRVEDEDNDDDLFGYDFSQGYNQPGTDGVESPPQSTRSAAPLVAAAARTQATSAA